jgi:PhzF family phenazine biosynthesis protein
MPVTVLQIDAFTDRPFAGNPAAVCLLDAPAEAVWMQNVAAEMNLSETAFIHPLEDGFALRWFTPAVEVELCGHATLASAHALWSEERVASQQPIRFHTASGWLTASRSDDLIELDFPATPASPIEMPNGLPEALGHTAAPIWLGQNRFDRMLVVASEGEVRQMTPNFGQLATLTERGIMVTSRSGNPQFDFISRYFAPAAGIDEDPVTGSAHCTLAPYWAEQLGKTQLVGYQASPRGGVVQVALRDDRVALRGHAVTVLRGQLAI